MAKDEGRGVYNKPRRCSGSTWAPEVCKIMAFIAIIMGLGLFYILLGFR